MAFCKACGKPLENDARFCPNCGATVEAAPQPQPTFAAEPIVNSDADRFSTSSMVMGIISLGLTGLFWSIGGTIPGIILGILAMNNAKKSVVASGAENSKAKAGRIMGLIGTIAGGVVSVFSVFYWIFYITMLILSSI